MLVQHVRKIAVAVSAVALASAVAVATPAAAKSNLGPGQPHHPRHHQSAPPWLIKMHDWKSLPGTDDGYGQGAVQIAEWCDVLTGTVHLENTEQNTPAVLLRGGCDAQGKSVFTAFADAPKLPPGTPPKSWLVPVNTWSREDGGSQEWCDVGTGTLIGSFWGQLEIQRAGCDAYGRAVMTPPLTSTNDHSDGVAQYVH